MAARDARPGTSQRRQPDDVMRRIGVHAVPKVCAALVAAATACLACASSAFTVPIRPARNGNRPFLSIASVTLEPESSRLVFGYETDRYQERELSHLTQSLKDSAAQFAPPANPSHSVHVVIRRVLVGTSSNVVFALACVTWAAVKPSGEILYSEQFYARSVDHLGWPGKVKNDVNKIIATRVLQAGVSVASGEKPDALATGKPQVTQHSPAQAGSFVSDTREYPPDDDQPFETYEAAVEDMPTSMHLAGSVQTAGPSQHMQTKVGGGEDVQTDLEWARVQGDFDWKSYLERQGRVLTGGQGAAAENPKISPSSAGQ